MNPTITKTLANLLFAFVVLCVGFGVYLLSGDTEVAQTAAVGTGTLMKVDDAVRSYNRR